MNKKTLVEVKQVSRCAMGIYAIRQRSDYVTEVKIRCWASNQIMLESVQDCTQWRMAGSLKIPLIHICFPTFVKLPDKCNNI